MDRKTEKVFKLSWAYRLVFTWVTIIVLFLIFYLFPFLHIGSGTQLYVISLFVSILTILIIMFSFEVNIDIILDDTQDESDFHNRRFKSDSELIKYYYKEEPIEFIVDRKSFKIPASTLWKFGEGQSLESFKTIKAEEEFRLPEELLGTRNRISNLYSHRIRKEFSPYDKICICRFCKETKNNQNSEYLFYVSKANLIDEYTTIQNPDSEIISLGSGMNKTVRDFFSSDGKLPNLKGQYDIDNGEPRPIPYRIAMHIIIETSDGYLLFQKRSSTRVATSPGETTSSAGGGMDWADYRHSKTKGIEHFVYREIREETTLGKNNLYDVRVKAVIREFRRIGQPVLIILGKTNMPYYKVIKRIETSKKYAQNTWLYPYWFIWSSILGKSGREYWEMETLIGIKKEEISNFLVDPNIQPPTKVALLLIRDEYQMKN